MPPRHRTADERYVARICGDPIKALERALQIERREIHFGQLAWQIDELERRLGSVAVRHMLSPVRGAAILAWTGAASGTGVVLAGSFTVSISATGTTTFTVSALASLNFTGIAAGAGSGSADFASTANQDGTGGGGSGVSTSGTVITMVPGKNYATVVPAGGAQNANGSDLTVSDGSTIVLLQGGRRGHRTPNDGNTTGGSKGLAASSTGSNLHDGADGGDGGTETGGHAASSGGPNATFGAGGGGGGQPADLSSSAQPGGNGADHGGQAADTSGTGHGGDGGPKDFNGVECGFGGGGRNNDNNGDLAGRPGGQAGCKLAA